MPTHSEALWEATATHEEIRKKLVKPFTTIHRRFRVEDSRAGNSRMVTKALAERTRARYGGRIVEVIPFTSAAERHAKPMDACPTCKAENGQPCKSKNDKLRDPHAARWVAFHEAQDAKRNPIDAEKVKR